MKIKNTFEIIVFSLIFFLLSGCASTHNAVMQENLHNIDTPQKSNILNPKGNFVLYVSNQSFAITPIDIKISVDDIPVVNESFSVKGQHNWKTFVLKLSPGKHKIDVSSQKGDAALSKNFEVKDKHWAVIDYWYYPKSHYDPTPKQFSFEIQDKQIYFE